MTLERLEQYADLRREVAELAARRDRAEERAKTRTRAVVQSSALEFPYQRQTVVVKGCSKQAMEIYGRLERRYGRRLSEMLRELEEIETWLDTVTDRTVRRLIQVRFLEHDDLTWDKAAQRVLGCRGGGDAARKRVTRYLCRNVKTL